MWRWLGAVVLASALAVSCAEAEEGISPGAWQGVRTGSDGRELVIGLIGAREYHRNDPCSVHYWAEARESDDELRVRVHGRRAPRPGDGVGCTMEGHARIVRVRLKAPLGDRRVVDEAGGQHRPVFQWADLRQPGWLPPGLVFASDFPSYEGRVWIQTWMPESRPPPDPRAPACEPGPAGLSLSQGPPDVLSPTRLARDEPLTPVDVGGAAGVTTGTRVFWSEGAMAFLAESATRCGDDTDVPLDHLLQFARSLRTPAGS